MPVEVNFKKIARKFDVNICTLRIFNNQIGGLVEEHDKKAIDQQTADFANLIGITTEELERLQGLSSEDFQAAIRNKSIGQQEQIVTEESRQLPDEQIAIIQKLPRVNDALFIHKFFGFIKKSLKIIPIQAFILRRSALISLVSYFEFIIAELIHSFYSLYPQALPSEERVLSLSDLREIGSIEEAENELIQREIDSLLRESLEKQLEYISKRLKVNLDALTPYKDRLIEISQRRNIFVHNDGIVNKIYLTHVSTELLEDGTKDGMQLDVTEEYLNQAIDSIYISGVMLIQLCWRKWQKAKSDEADIVYIDLIYEALRENEYEFIRKLKDFSTSLEYASDRSKRVIVVNHAIALRELEEAEEMEEIINTLDWTSCSLEFRAALLALRKEEDKLLKILPTAIAAKEIGRIELEEWPLFIPFHKSPDYIELLNSCPKEIELSK